METAALPAPGRLASVNAALALSYKGWTGDGSPTGIDKRPLDGRVAVRGNQVVGDHVVDASHGGRDQAVYAYAREDAAFWAAELAREVRPGAFGENFSTEGVDVTGAVIGECWAVGSALFEVSGPRIPCRTFAGFWDVPDLVKRFTAEGRPGAYLRILTEGEVGAGDELRIAHRPEHGVTVGEVFRALTGDRELAPRLLTAPELPAKHRKRAEKWLSQAEPV